MVDEEELNPFQELDDRWERYWVTWEIGSKWEKIKLVCSPKNTLKMMWIGNLWWKPFYVWMLVLAFGQNIWIAWMIARGRI